MIENYLLTVIAIWLISVAIVCAFNAFTPWLKHRYAWRRPATVLGAKVVCGKMYICRDTKPLSVGSWDGNKWTKVGLP